MNSETVDVLGWTLPVLAVFLVVGAIAHFGDETLILAGAVLLLAVAEKRRAKIITTSLVRFVDEKGTLRGLAGWNGEGIQISVRTDPVNNVVSIAYPVLWQGGPNVSFTFNGNLRTVSESEKEMPVPRHRGFQWNRERSALLFVVI